MFNFRRYEYWRAHPALKGPISSLLPGFAYGAALAAGYVVLDQLYGPLIPHKYHAGEFRLSACCWQRALSSMLHTHGF